MPPPKRAITNLVACKDTCSGCGVCVGVCPQSALTMGIASMGDLVPQWDGNACTDCGLCTVICPFSTGVHDPRELNKALFGGGNDGVSLAFHADVGWFQYALVGYSSLYRPTSSSGGLVTALLADLLRRHEVDAVAVVGQSITSDGVAFSFRKVTTVDDLPRFSGSVYHPVEISALVAEMGGSSNERWAVVGVPCLCAALRSASSRQPRLRRAVAYVLGLACGMYQNTMYTELLARKSGFALSAVAHINYRIKNLQGPANDYGFQAVGTTGGKGKIIPYHGLPLFLGTNGYFRCNACNYCKDVFAEASDACFMDAWLPEYRSDPRGTSLVVVRDAHLGDILKSSATCVVEEIPIEQVVRSQQGQVRRKRKFVEIRLGRKRDGFGLHERFRWWLQRTTQRRSKQAWARYGRSGRVWCFWLVIADLLVLQTTAAFLQRVGAHLAAISASARRTLAFWRLL